MCVYEECTVDYQLIMTDHSYFFIAFVCIAATSPVCETDCNPTRRHPECCSDENSGKFLEVENNSFVIRYIVCPVTKPDYCDMI